MKKIGVVLLFIFLLSGCSLLGDILYWECPEKMNTIDDAFLYLRENVSPLVEPFGEDYWQYPYETIELGTGDCEDMAGVLAHLFIYNLNMSTVTLIRCKKEGSKTDHIVVKAGSIYYEATKGPWIITNFNDKYKTILEMSYIAYLERTKISHIF